MPETLEFFASAIPGTEKALCDELRELNFKSVRLNRGGIPFRGPWQEGWRACLESRIAQRIQVLLSRFGASTQEALYSGIQGIDWTRFVTHRQTISVNAVSRGSQLNHSGFVALKTKDAIVDQIRAATGKRPDVDTDDPDVKVFIYVANDRVAAYLDLAGDPLHKRGYRMQTGEAPLRETLASAVLRLSGWDRKTPLIDPMCGSGTIAIEAALWASNRAPGLNRERFGFERWANFGDAESATMRELKGALRSNIDQQPKIQACDISEEAVGHAQANAKRAGVRISVKTRSVLDLQAGGKRCLLVTNPPYGARLDLQPEFCSKFAALISRLHGWRVALLSGTKEYERLISAKPEFTAPLANGDIDCDMLTYEIE